MGTKQVKMEFQVVANDGVSANVTVTFGGTQVFSGPLNQTTDVMPGIVVDDLQPYSLVEFDLDVTDQPLPPGNQNVHGQYTYPIDISVQVTGGSITMQATEANYNAVMADLTPPVGNITSWLQAGTSTKFAELWPNAQPLVNGEALTTRYNYPNSPQSGPGAILLLDTETVTYPLAMTYYCDFVPAPT